MVRNIEAGDFRFRDHNIGISPVGRIFGFEISEGPRSGESAWENPQRPNKLLQFATNLRNSCGLVDLAPGGDDPLLFGDVGWLVVLADLVDLLHALASEDGPGVSEVGDIAGVIVYEGDEAAAAGVIALLGPLPLDGLEGILEGLPDILLPPLIGEERPVQMLLEELRALLPTVPVIHAEPLHIVL